ncbi:hypothetical protein ACFPRL_20380 [Pseudoclavibacter helvolus]
MRARRVAEGCGQVRPGRGERLLPHGRGRGVVEVEHVRRRPPWRARSRRRTRWRPRASCRAQGRWRARCA